MTIPSCILRGKICPSDSQLCKVTVSDQKIFTCSGRVKDKVVGSIAFPASSVELNNSKHDENCSSTKLGYSKEPFCKSILFGSNYILEGLHQFMMNCKSKILHNVR